MYVNGQCTGLFGDTNDNLYCSMSNIHQVIKKSLTSSTNSSTIVTGNGFNGSLSNMLNSPNAIFIDINFDLYVADYYNNRIQLFRPGELNGKTLVGDEVPAFNQTILDEYNKELNIYANIREYLINFTTNLTIVG
jgi:hypothetical protein